MLGHRSHAGTPPPPPIVKTNRHLWSPWSGPPISFSVFQFVVSFLPSTCVSYWGPWCLASFAHVRTIVVDFFLWWLTLTQPGSVKHGIYLKTLRSFYHGWHRDIDNQLCIWMLPVRLLRTCPFPPYLFISLNLRLQLWSSAFVTIVCMYDFVLRMQNRTEPLKSFNFLIVICLP